MDELIRQVRAAAGAGLHYLALAGALMLPDACAGLGHRSGRANGSRYIAWATANLPDYDPRVLYGFRCSLLHQHSAYPDKHPDTRVIFVEPGGPLAIHRGTMKSGTETAFVIDVPAFCNEVADAAEQWLHAEQANPVVRANLGSVVSRHPEGIPPWIVGTAVCG